MKYLTPADIDLIVDGFRGDSLARLQTCGCTPAELDLLRNRDKAHAHTTATAKAFERALKKNGGPFKTQQAAQDATRAELEADWNAFLRVFRILLKVVATLYPQSRLFVIVFDALFTYWTFKNLGTVTH